ncbi:ATP-binding cassette domain-containing protein [Blastomonas sp. SL216]|uniref:ATP-binding cassette domain-containing protein n=1 Tax=Blastomonas sp. SL216 TaxID=2995169 RepID=UPI00237728B8|nr:ABC transporter ATP-binding protein [Blastomonas sp. SL216]
MVAAAHWRWYGSYLQRRWRALALFALAGAALAAINLPLLVLLHRSLDAALSSKSLVPLGYAAALFLVLRAATAGVTILISRRSAPILRQLGADMRIEIVEALHTRLWQDVASMEDASIQAKLIHDTERVEQMSQRLFNSVLPQLVPLAGYAILAIVLSWQLALLAAVLALALQLAANGAHRMLSRETIRFQHMFDRFHVEIVRVLHMMPTSILLGHERASIRQFSSEARQLADSGARLSWTMVAAAQLQGMTHAVLICALLLAGGAMVLGGTMTPGALFTLLVTLRLASAALGPIIAALPLTIAGDNALSHLYLMRDRGRTLDAETEDTAPDLARLELRDIGFAYGSRSILNGVSLNLVPGQVTAIVAPNGIGKTTLLNIAAGVLHPDQGTANWITTDGQRIDARHCRQQIGAVPQHPRFFHASFRDNILCHRANLGEAALAQAIAQAALVPVIDRHPERLEALVVDGGELLSGGERQRLAIARALVNQPALLVLDEPTNHLDHGALDRILDAILSVNRPPAVLVATHDERMLRRADIVYRLDTERLQICDAADWMAVA